jgi:SAM-dependent methyltransferase
MVRLDLVGNGEMRGLNEEQDGGYDEGYRVCPCFWGVEPAGLVRQVTKYFSAPENVTVALDIGCGEGKNAYYLACQDIQVRAIDISPLAIENAKATWPQLPNIVWEIGDLRRLDLPAQSFDIIVATGPLHCLNNVTEVNTAINRLKTATKQEGFHVISVFNDRLQDLSGHALDFSPCLMPHEYYIEHYRDWQIFHESDQDLEDLHPHNQVPHRHSITRILARRN